MDTVRKFAAELGRQDRQRACTAYLERLLGISPASEPEHVMSNFVNRSLWSADAVMRRLRALLWQRSGAADGWLGLAQFTVSRAGFDSVAWEQVRPEYAKGVLTRSQQRGIVWFWLSENYACPIAARLYVPKRWTLSPEAEASFPAPVRQYRTRGEIACDLLQEISVPKREWLRLAINEQFTFEWGLFDALFETAELVLCRLDPEAPWPIETEHIPASRPLEEADRIDRYLHTRGNRLLIEELSRLNKRRGFAPKLFPSCPQAAEPLLRRKRFLFAHTGYKGTLNAFMANIANGRELAAGPNQFVLLDQGIRSLTSMIRRFEGRTWLGFHHHLAMAAVAYYLVGTEEVGLREAG